MQIQKVNSNRSFGMLVKLKPERYIEADMVKYVERGKGGMLHMIMLSDGKFAQVPSKVNFAKLVAKINAAKSTGLLEQILDEVRGINAKLGKKTKIKK